MSNTLDYGRRRSGRPHRWVLAVAPTAAVAGLFAARSWRAHRARLEDHRLYLEQQRSRQDFERAFQRGPGPASNRAAVQRHGQG
jgi:hypothetical protein